MTDIWLFSYIALWALVLLNSVLVVSSLRHIGIFYERERRRMGRISTLKNGERLPDLELSHVDGTTTQVSEFAGRATQLVVVTPHCSGCENLLTALAEQDEASVAKHWVIVGIGEAAEVIDLVRRSGLTADVPVLIDGPGRVRAEWGVAGTPLTIEMDETFIVRRQTAGMTELPRRGPTPALAT